METLVAVPICPLHTAPNPNAPLADEALCGMGVEAVEDSAPGWVRVYTCYGYPGHVRRTHLAPAPDGWGAAPLRTVLYRDFCDVLPQPDLRAIPLVTLPRGARVTPTGEEEGGWLPVLLADGRRGWLRPSVTAPCPAAPEQDESALRRRVVEYAALYQGAPYRWGGKTPLGVDCSGLCSMVYLLCGVTIWRDAQLRPGWPVRPIDLSRAGPGDLLYFPGHMALYLGAGSYLHATAHPGSDGVTVSSLDPSHPNYRADLALALEAVGSIFVAGPQPE